MRESEPYKGSQSYATFIESPEFFAFLMDNINQYGTPSWLREWLTGEEKYFSSTLGKEVSFPPDLRITSSNYLTPGNFIEQFTKYEELYKYTKTPEGHHDMIRRLDNTLKIVTPAEEAYYTSYNKQHPENSDVSAETIQIDADRDIEILDKKLHPSKKASKEDSKASTHSEPSKKIPPLSHLDHVHEHGTIDRMEEQKGSSEAVHPELAHLVRVPKPIYEIPIPATKYTLLLTSDQILEQFPNPITIKFSEPAPKAESKINHDSLEETENPTNQGSGNQGSGEPRFWRAKAYPHRRSKKSMK